MNKKVFPSLVFLVIILASLACGGGSASTPQVANTATSVPGTPAEPTATKEPTETPTLSAPQVFSVGDVVKLGNFSLAVVGWGDFQATQTNQPEEGNKFISVDVVVVNTSDFPVTVSSYSQFTVKDESDQQYKVDIVAATMALTKGNPDSSLLPGERIRGSTLFQVPEDAKGLQVVFDASVWNAGKAFIDLGDEPITKELPGKLEGETDQKTYKSDETARAGSFLVTINEVKTVTGSQFTKPGAGNKFILIDLTLENTGNTSENVSSALQMWVKDQTSQKYRSDLVIVLAEQGTAPDGEIVAGEKIKGQVAFEVPENATGLLFVFDPSYNGADKAFIELP